MAPHESTTTPSRRVREDARTPSRRTLRRSGAGLAGLLGLALAGLPLLGAAPANAAPTNVANVADVAAVQPGATSDTPTVPVMIILDASGSMNEKDAPGSRIDAAKKAVKSLVRALPPTAEVGLTVYGATTSASAADKTKGCQDIRTLMPVTKLDASGISAAVDAVKASGYTPIGNALRAAAKALPAEGPRSIVLVSDGEDTCAPPAPCDVAKALKKQGVDLTVHTVGFRVGAKARKQLTCVAAATGGTYSDATNAPTLSSALQTKVDQAITGYSVKGTKITGADQLSEQAPLLRPGQYLDTYAKGSAEEGGSMPAGTTKYYTVALQRDANLYVAATLVGPPRTGGRPSSTAGVTVTLRARDNFRCDDDRETTSINALRHGPTTAVLSRDLSRPVFVGRCPSEGIGIIEIERRGTAWQQEALPMEIVVRSEPAADSSGVAPGFTRAEPGLSQPNFGAARPITAGSSFNDAPELTSGLTYTETIQSGDDQFFKIPMQWGQRFSYSVDEVKRSVSKDATPVYVRLDFWNPMRQEVYTTHGSSGEPWFAGRDTEPLTGTSNVPVRYTNRANSGPSTGHYQLDGFYYVRLTSDFAPKQSTTRYRIKAVVSGSSEAGPRYVRTGDSTSSQPSSPPSPTSAATTTTRSTTQPPAGTATTAASAPPTDPRAVAASQPGAESGGLGTGAIALILGAALGGAGLTTLVLQARSRRQHPAGTQQ